MSENERTAVDAMLDLLNALKSAAPDDEERANVQEMIDKLEGRIADYEVWKDPHALMEEVVEEVRKTLTPYLRSPAQVAYFVVDTRLEGQVYSNYMTTHSRILALIAAVSAACDFVKMGGNPEELFGQIRDNLDHIAKKTQILMN